MKKYWRYTLLTFILMSTLQLSGCFDIPDEFILPEWDVDLNIPMIKRSYQLEEIIKSEDQKYIKLNPADDSLYYIQSETDTLGTDIKEFVKITTAASIIGEVIKVEDQNKTIYLEFPEGARLDEAEFTAGFLAFALRNPSNTSINFQITIPGIKNPAGQIFSLQRNIAPFSSDSIEYNLAGYKYKEPSNQLFLFKGQIWIQAKAVTQNPKDSVILSAYSSDMDLKYATGYIPKRSLGTKRTSFFVDLADAKDFEGKVRLKEAKINLLAKYVSPVLNPFEIALKGLQITAVKNSGATKQLLINGQPKFDIDFVGGIYDTVFTELNSNITEFMSFLPDSIVIEGEFIINPKDSKITRTVTNEDSVIFETDFSTRSIFGIVRSSLTDTTEVDISKDDRKSILDANSAFLSVELKNGIAMSVWLKADLYDSSYNYLFSITKNSNGTDSINVAGASIGPDGKVTAPAITTTKIELTKEEIEKLSRAYNVIYRVLVETTNPTGVYPPPYVVIRGSDWIEIRVTGGVNYRVKPEENKD
ncbi:MAG: hypothetical protein AB9882_07115 [Ignavibacteriaceae bacterium]